jgi:hypothetical protein
MSVCEQPSTKFAVRFFRSKDHQVGERCDVTVTLQNQSVRLVAISDTDFRAVPWRLAGSTTKPDAKNPKCRWCSAPFFLVFGLNPLNVTGVSPFHLAQLALAAGPS